ncbi:MAG: hypothetical protein V4819_17540 [Verrucomicrobiota bacterium]
MKLHRIILLASVSSVAVSEAATILENTTTPLAGVPYRWEVGMDGTDSATFSRHVGAWSWEDESLFPNPGDPVVGWTHTSDWAVVTISDASRFTLRIERDASVPWPGAGEPDRLASVASMYPSFTVWSGADIDGTQVHTYNNRGNVAWAEDLTFLDFTDNSTLGFVEKSWDLPAGQYSIVLGSNSPATDNDRQGYKAILTTVPEPGAAMLLLCGLAGSCVRRRKA